MKQRKTASLALSKDKKNKQTKKNSSAYPTHFSSQIVRYCRFVTCLSVSHPDAQGLVGVSDAPSLSRRKAFLTRGEHETALWLSVGRRFRKDR